MKKTIRKAWLSQKGTSINFTTNNDNYFWSVKIGVLQNEIADKYLKDPQQLQGLSIEINEQNMSYKKDGDWVFVNDLSFKDNTFDDLPIINDSSSVDLNAAVVAEDDSDEDFEEIYKKSYFSTLLKGVIFIDTYQDFAVETLTDANIQSTNLQDEAEISVLQNFINRGKMVKEIQYQNASSIIMTLILEMFKNKHFDKWYLTAPEQLKSHFSDSLKELKRLIQIYDHVFKKNILHLMDYVNEKNIEFVVDNNDREEISCSTNDDETIMTFKRTHGTQDVDPINFITIQSVDYVSFININGQEQKKSVTVLNKILELGFGEEKFNISQFKYEQLLALDSILNKKSNVLAILKTGFGKSLIYQFISLLQPNLMFIVFPINSLIQDQSTTLREVYNLSYFLSNDELKSKKLVFDEGSFIHNRAFLITPERIENEKFLKNIIKFAAYTGFMIFDEAHCISEWGHDFRPAYLVARHVMKNIKDQNDSFRVIGLTATASPFVQRDISANLNVSQHNVINIADTSGLKRKELIFSLKKLDVPEKKNLNDWLNFVHKQFANIKTLDGKQIFYFIRAGNNRYRSSNISALYAYNYINQNFENISIGLYTGQNKLITNHSGEPTFNDFKTTKTIFSTKSFGMGINLSDCNYITFIELPASLEDLYQQAGRAGRIGQKSLIDVYYSPNNLVDPLADGFSSHKWFLQMRQARKEYQPKFLIALVQLILQKGKSFVLNVDGIMKSMNIQRTAEYDDYLKFAISHLINEMEIINFYSIVYSWTKMHKIKIHIKQAWSKQDVTKQLNFVLQKYSLEEESNKDDSYESKIRLFYDWYFNEIQKQKILGFNILRKTLSNRNWTNNTSHSEIIYEILEEYYKTRSEALYTKLDFIFKSLTDQDSLEKVKESINALIKASGEDDFIQNISQYKINNEYIKLVSLIAFLDYEINPLVWKIEDLFIIKNDYLNSLKDKIIINFWNNIKKKSYNQINHILNYLDKNGSPELVTSYITNNVIKEIYDRL